VGDRRVGFLSFILHELVIVSLEPEEVIATRKTVLKNRHDLKVKNRWHTESSISEEYSSLILVNSLISMKDLFPMKPKQPSMNFNISDCIWILSW
jgi:hypothetical protein